MTEPPVRRSKPAYYLSDDGRVAFPRERSVVRRIVTSLIILSGLGAVAGVVAVGVFLLHEGRTPREWAPYLQRRVDGHRPLMVDATNVVAGLLVRADRLPRGDVTLLPPILGASVARSGPVPPGRLRPVATLDELKSAVASAQPGDVIQLSPGHYRFEGSAIQASQPGTAEAPIWVRAATLGEVVIESAAVETFKVTAPFWRFENLTMRGVCGDDADCEHAIHVGGRAMDVIIRNNRLEDYNAEVKVNGEDGAWPDHGVIEGNTLIDTRPRMTDAPITPVDLVGASDWRVSGNFIADFVRGVQGGATYGGFFKGAGQNNVFERNLVVCEWNLRDMPGSRVGLSLGGGGTDEELRRDKGAMSVEQVGGIIRNNLIAFCSDDGIYLNRSARSLVDHNTLLDTAGIDGRFVETSGTVTANIVDGAVRARDDAVLEGWDNDRPFLLGLYAGWHPQRGYYRDPATLDLTWKSAPDSIPAAHNAGTDLCGAQRGPTAPAGAFDDYGACLREPQ